MPDWYDSAANSPDYTEPGAGRPISEGDVEVYDPGQLGAGNLPTLHGPHGVDNQFVTPDPHRTNPLPGDPALQPASKRGFRLAPAMYDPYVFTNQPEDAGESGGSWVHSGGLPFYTGSPTHPLVIVEHGPETLEEAERIGAVQRPQKNQNRSWWRKLLYLDASPRNLDNKDAFDERVMPAVGAILPGELEEEQRRGSAAAVAARNAFVIPDVRRTFDNPPGHPEVDKAGWQLTTHEYEASPYKIHSAPADLDLVDTVSIWFDDRPRAGAAYPTEGRHATVPRWFTIRPFDQLMAQRLTGMKGQMKQPLISRPIFTTAEPLSEDAGWTAGWNATSPAPGMDAVSVHPNTDRTVPMPWDQDLIDVGSGGPDSGIGVQSGYRQSGWRAS